MSLTALFIAGAVICVLLSAFFSASEMALSSCSRVRIEHMAEEGVKAAKIALKVLDHFENALSAILLGNNLVNIAASSFASMAAIRLAGEGATWAATALLTAAVIIIGETIPKILAQKHATSYSLKLGRPVSILMVVFYPIVFLTVKLLGLFTHFLKGEPNDEDTAAEELHSIIETAEDEEVLDEQTSELVNAAIDFSDISAQDVMTARVDLSAIDIDASEEEIYGIAANSGHSRLPVYEDGLDNIIGILHVNHYLKALTGDGKRGPLRELLMPVTYVYKAMKLPNVLSELKAGQQQLAVVTDEYGGTLGVVTLEDVLEELVGEIWDETDTVERDLTVREDGSYEVDGSLLLDEFAERVGWRQDSLDFESETVGGWCIEMLGHFPQEGESFDYRNYTFHVVQVGERRVLKVLVSPKTADGA